MSRRLVVEADGGSRGNPGPAGYGALVRDAETGTVLVERAATIGVATNNVAEYRGLIAGLQAALELAPGPVEVRMDSKLVIEQMAGRWQVKHPSMRPLAREAAGLAAQLVSVRWTWVPRERNSAADRLANQALDGHPVHRGPGPPGPGEAGPGGVEPAPSPATRLPGWNPAAAPPHRLLLLRHGQTEHSAQRRFSGRSDPPLSELGQAQARAAARRLGACAGVERVLSSPLQRAAATAAAVAAALGLSVEVDPQLRETDFGQWEGLTFEEARQRWPREFAAWLADAQVAPPGGESLAQTGQRVAAARQRLLGVVPSGCSIVVSHTTPIKALVCDAVLAPFAGLYRLHLDLASLSVLDCYPDGVSVLTGFNDTTHLSAGAEG